MLSKEDKLNIVKLFNSGKTYREIGNIYNLSRDAVRGIVRRNNDVKIEVKKETTSPFDKLEIEKQQIRQEKAEIKKYMREYATFDNILEQIQNSIYNLPQLDIPVLIKDVYLDCNQELVMVISDTHIGQIGSLEFNNFDNEILKERLVKYFNEVKLIAETHNIKKIHICFVGDLIEGLDIYKNINAYSDIDPIDQVIRISEVLSNLINQLSYDYLIEINYVYGNHSRISNNLKSTTNFEKLIFEFIKIRLERNRNVIIHNSNGLYHVVSVLGYNYMLFHGDVLKDKEHAPLRLKDIMNEDGYFIDAIIVGHYHHFYNREMFASGDGIICCGSLIGANDYSFKKLQVASKSSQTCFVVNENKGRYATYRVILN